MPLRITDVLRVGYSSAFQVPSQEFFFCKVQGSASVALKTVIFHHKEVSAFHLGMKHMLVCVCTQH